MDPARTGGEGRGNGAPPRSTDPDPPLPEGEAAKTQHNVTAATASDLSTPIDGESELETARANDGGQLRSELVLAPVDPLVLPQSGPVPGLSLPQGIVWSAPATQNAPLPATLQQQVGAQAPLQPQVSLSGRPVAPARSASLSDSQSSQAGGTERSRRSVTREEALVKALAASAEAGLLTPQGSAGQLTPVGSVGSVTPPGQRTPPLVSFPLSHPVVTYGPPGVPAFPGGQAALIMAGIVGDPGQERADLPTSLRDCSIIH